MTDHAVEDRSCVDTDKKISLDEQHRTVDKYSMAGRFGPKVLFTFLQCGSCKQLTKTFRSKHSAIEYLALVVYCQSSEISLMSDHQ